MFSRTAQVRDPATAFSNLTFRAQSEGGAASEKRDRFKNALIRVLPDVSDVDVAFDDESRPVVRFQTPDGWIPLDDMSWGYQVFAAFAADYASRMLDWHPQSDDPLSEPGICLVDEIDLHMHPGWQRSVFEHLSRVFPMTQFVVTAHSPLVVQAEEVANIALLQRDPADSSRVRIKNEVEDIKRWRIDQILTSDLFGLESARSVAVERELAERKALLAKAELAPDEVERLKELRMRAVDLPTPHEPAAAAPSDDWDAQAQALLREAAAKLKAQA